MKTTFLGSVMLLGVVLSSVGCSKEQAAELAASVRKQAGDAADKASQAVQDTVKKASDAASSAGDKILDAAPGVADFVASGSADLKIGSDSHSFAGSYCRFVPVSPKHGSVLQVRSYASLENERFPSYFFQAKTTDGGLSSLVGQEIPGQLFVQLEEGGPVWFSNEPVVARLSSIDGESVLGEFVGGKLTSPSALVADASGKFTASIQP